MQVEHCQHIEPFFPYAEVLDPSAVLSPYSERTRDMRPPVPILLRTVTCPSFKFKGVRFRPDDKLNIF